MVAPTGWLSYHCYCLYHTDTASTGTLPTLPIFTPSAGANGLGMLAAAAGSAHHRPVNPPLLAGPGPFNPAASLPIKTVKKILDLEFLEMAEVTMDPEPAMGPGKLPPPGRLPITDISQWLERFSLMAATLVTRFPDKAPEFFAYQATIIRAERNYESGHWVSYDRQYRREALARKNLDWSVPDPRLFSEAFTGRARSIPRCTFCLRDDHTGQNCPSNPDRAWSGWFPGPTSWAVPSQAWSPKSAPLPPRQELGSPLEVCRRFNEGRCRLAAKCRYLHTCKECGNKGHPAVTCPRSQHLPPGRSRSPRGSVPSTQPAWLSSQRY